jgi:quercetin dioxygenase-like cupin family protein
VWASLDDLPSIAPLEGVTMHSLTGEKLMLNFVRIAPHAVVPMHHHPHEQAGTVLEGVLILTIGDETRHLRYGDAYAIPPNVPHGATTDEQGCLVIDVFTPPREDYLRQTD